MVCGTFTMTGVPGDNLVETKAMFENNDPPPTKVSAEQQDDGTYTITAVFPACPEGTSHSTAGA